VGENRLEVYRFDPDRSLLPLPTVFLSRGKLCNRVRREALCVMLWYVSLMNTCECHSKWVKVCVPWNEKYDHAPFRKRADSLTAINYYISLRCKSVYLKRGVQTVVKINGTNLNRPRVQRRLPINTKLSSQTMMIQNCRRNAVHISAYLVLLLTSVESIQNWIFNMHNEPFELSGSPGVFTVSYESQEKHL
jgi:hypothetical protein